MAIATTRKAGPTFDSLLRDVQEGKLSPVYCLMGAEPYYIDVLAAQIIEQALRPEERDFNLVTLYGPDTGTDDVINAARAYPLGAERTVVCVKEAQGLGDIDRLEYYLKKPQPQTVLILCHKNGTLDRRRKLAGLIEKTGVLFESKKPTDRELPAFISGYLKARNCGIQPQAVQLLVDHVGADLSRMVGELDKLLLSLPAVAREVSVALVSAHIGVSKEFNIFELQDAIANKDAYRAFRIANYFDKNPKQNPIQKTLPALFRFFSTLMTAYYCPDRSERGLAQWLGLADWQVRRNVLPAMRNYTGRKTIQIISAIRRADARSKGVDNPSTPDGEIMKELLCFILY